MIRCTSFTVQTVKGRPIIYFEYDKTDDETGELTRGNRQSMYVVDEDLSKAVNTIHRFIAEHGDISEESLKPRRY